MRTNFFISESKFQKKEKEPFELNEAASIPKSSIEFRHKTHLHTKNTNKKEISIPLFTADHTHKEKFQKYFHQGEKNTDIRQFKQQNSKKKGEKKSKTVLGKKGNKMI